jgi:PAS domain S-box-containing protein
MGQISTTDLQITDVPETAKLGAEAEAGMWFFENARDLFAVVAPDGVLLRVNPAWADVTGWSREDLVGRPFGELVHPESFDAVRAIVQALTEVGHSETSIRILCKSGGTVWLEGYSRTGPQGEMMGMLRDVTEERQRATDLKRVQEAQSLLSETAGVGLWRFDPRTDVITWSAEWQSMLAEIGVSMATPDEFAAVCHPDDVEMVFAVMDACIEHGRPGAFAHRFQAADGRWIWTSSHVRAEAVEPGVHVIHGISQNITELREALSAVTAAQGEAEAHMGRLKIALSAAKAAVVETDYAAGSVWTSPELETLIGQPMTFDQARRTVWSFFDPADAEAIEAAVASWLQGQRPEPLEVRIMTAEGQVRWVRIYTEIETDAAGRWRRTISLLVDVDERHRQEEALVEAERRAQSATEAKSQFLANMSHEIRTPMNGVMGVLHLLKSQTLPSQAKEMLDEALACGAMLQALLDDVVDFSRIEAGRLELDMAAIDPTAIVQGVVRLLRPQAEDKGLRVVLDIEPLPAWVSTNDVRLRQCLFNLIGNAIKFTSAGSVTVRAKPVGGRPDLRLRFEVEDTGIGISEASRQILFQRFQQADATTARRYGGSGLGLVITSRLAELLGGEVGVTSQEGEGSCFWLEIAAPETDPPEIELQAAGDVLAGLRCLVVEDNPTNRMIATKMLEGLGATVETAHDGAAGVAAALQGGFDFILMDIQMPGLDGPEATRRIRASGGPVASTPIIALTANVLSHQREAYLAAGMNGVVGKPISPAALLQELVAVATAS